MNTPASRYATPLAIALMAVLALVREAHTPFNVDNGWLLYAASRLLHGDRLYIDMLETNPPLIVWLNIIPAAIAGWLHINAMTVFAWCVSALNLLSLYCISVALKRQQGLSAGAANALLLFFAFALFILPMNVYGEREHLWVALMLPYLVRSIAVSRVGLPVALMAAVGFALKPFFLAVWIANELYLAWTERRWQRVCAPHNIAIAAVQLIYVLSIVCFTPEYLSTIAPMLWQVYFPFNGDLSDIIEVTGGVLAALLLLMALARAEGVQRRMSRHVFVLTTGCALVIILQKKGWSNHLYPLEVMALWCAVCVMPALAHAWRRQGFSMGYGRVAALCLGAGGLIWMGCITTVTSWNGMHPKNMLDSRLKDAIHRYAAHAYVYPLSFALSSGFPVINESDGIFRGGFHHLWPLPGVMLKEQQDAADPKITAIKEYVMDNLVRDFKRYPPALVWVDKNNRQGNPVLKNLNIPAYLSHDAAFAEVWKHYAWAGDIRADVPEAGGEYETYALYVREPR